MTNKIIIYNPSLVLIVGVSGYESAFAMQHFDATTILSLEQRSGLNQHNFTLDPLYCAVKERLQKAKLTVVDTTNMAPEQCKSLIQLARQYHILPSIIVLNIPLKDYTKEENHANTKAVSLKHKQLEQFIKYLKKSHNLVALHVLNAIAVVHTVHIECQPIWTDKSSEEGPFDIIGDIHGCFDETKQLLEKLGYRIQKNDQYKVTHPENRKIIFVGDLVDRGPNSVEVLRLVMDATASGIAFCVNGNHDDKLKRKLMGRQVTVAHGLQETLDQLANESEAFKVKGLNFLKGLASHLILDKGRLAVTHAGLKQQYFRRVSPRIHRFCMYGETTGEVNDFGLPVRHLWAKDYDGDTLIVYGHTPVPEPLVLNNTINIDTGCVFGGKLTALRYPEKTWVSVNAKKVYYAPIKPLDHSSLN